MLSRVLHILIVVSCALGLLGGSCGDNPSAPFSTIVPTGRWRLDTVSADGSLRYVSFIDLSSQSQGTARDSIFTDSAGTWSLVDVMERGISFASVGDGYHRGIEVASGDSGVIDSMPRYWYFLARGDSLRFYRGMRFVGPNTGLIGAWRLDRPDSLMMKGYLDLAITVDTIRVDNASTIEVATGHYHYSLVGNIMAIDGATFGFGGDRFDVVPGSSLYITSLLSSPYTRVR